MSGLVSLPGIKQFCPLSFSGAVGNQFQIREKNGGVLRSRVNLEVIPCGLLPQQFLKGKLKEDGTYEFSERKSSKGEGRIDMSGYFSGDGKIRGIRSAEFNSALSQLTADSEVRLFPDHQYYRGPISIDLRDLYREIEVHWPIARNMDMRLATGQLFLGLDNVFLGLFVSWQSPIGKNWQNYIRFFSPEEPRSAQAKLKQSVNGWVSYRYFLPVGVINKVFSGEDERKPQD